MKIVCTDKQGQHLAFFCYNAKVHGRSPSEVKIQEYFRFSPPSMHQRVLTQKTHGSAHRIAGSFIRSEWFNNCHPAQPVRADRPHNPCCEVCRNASRRKSVRYV